MAPRYRSSLSCLLTALILFGQTMLLVHQIDHDTQLTDNYCSECLAQPIFEGGLVIDNRAIPALLETETPYKVVPSYFSSLNLSTHSARAPPHYS